MISACLNERGFHKVNNNMVMCLSVKDGNTLRLI